MSTPHDEGFAHRAADRLPPHMEWAECRHCGTPLPRAVFGTPLNHITLQGFCSHECKVMFSMRSV